MTSFDRVSVQGPFAVIVTSGKPPSARASGDPVALERVQVRVEGRTLLVRPAASGWVGYPGREPAPAVVRVSTQAIASAALTGSGSLEVDRLTGARVSVTNEGSGRITIGRLEADVASLGAVGSGGIAVAGRAKQASLLARGAASVDAAGLSVADLALTSETAGAMTVDAIRSAKVSASGAGAVTITGTAACQVTRRGLGPLACGGSTR